MKKEVRGLFTKFNGEDFYKIENYDHMEDFFMTITSSSDVWNFCWSQGGITAGRIDSNHAIFPYYTADKVSDAKLVTGSYTAIAVTENGKTKFWEPFLPLCENSNFKNQQENITRNIYKNFNGTKIWFEEINSELKLTFRYGWTSSAKYGLVKMTEIENFGSEKKSITVLDGCKNILPASIDSNLQNGSSVLLDAYKKTDLDEESQISLFALSSVLTDKAEPSEALLANTACFTVEGKVYLSENSVKEFFENSGNISKLTKIHVLKGERPSCYLAKEINLEATSKISWEQVFNTFLSAAQIEVLKKEVQNKENFRKSVLSDIKSTDALMTTYLSESDGIQSSAQEMTCLHHRANVMFNIMRGGFLADSGKINGSDFIKFVSQRNKSKVDEAKKALGELAEKNSVLQNQIREKIESTKDSQLKRLFLEYMPVIFSRRHGDPSRPWNIFNIILNDKDGNPILNYEGNWRDIFQNWEALAWSYPSYVKNMSAKFLNAMTADGFNPYRINRAGIDWECPEPENPWAQYGYWGDHQVIYLEKLLELLEKVNKQELLSSLDEEIYTSSNIPYRIKSYKEICANPRSTILFDKELSKKLKAESELYGSDKKLLQGKDGQPYLLSLTAKLLQIVIAKSANLVPGGGIWMNTQRPEWNDANNALAGWGLSVVTLCYLNRMLSFLTKIYSQTELKSFTVPLAMAECFKSLSELYKNTNWENAIKDDKERKIFTDKAGLLFENERNIFYKNGYNDEKATLSSQEILLGLEAMQAAVKKCILANKRSDGLYHTYNTMILTETEAKIVHLPQMLEGQVAVLSSAMLSPEEALEITKALKQSPLFESRQYSYILYPNKELPDFLAKNLVKAEDLTELKDFIKRTGSEVLEKDINGLYHFNSEFRNARLMQDYFNSLPQEKQPNKSELEAILNLYEKTFAHQNFTGRSGTFYAYEGLGSIYWHMCSKLLLAVQENCLEAFKNSSPYAKQLEQAYYDVRKGLSFNKTPEVYGAFPSDPYSHTPFHKGAKQPGMTGQVKEEVLTRWGELGVCIEDGKAVFNPLILDEKEFFADKTLNFTWCGTKITYKKSGEKKITLNFADKTLSKTGSQLSSEETKMLFERTGQIKEIFVEF